MLAHKHQSQTQASHPQRAPQGQQTAQQSTTVREKPVRRPSVRHVAVLGYN